MKTNIIQCIHQMYSQAQTQVDTKQPLRIEKINGVWKFSQSQSTSRELDVNLNELVSDIVTELDELETSEATRVVLEVTQLFAKTFPDLSKKIDEARKNDLEKYQKAMIVIENAKKDDALVSNVLYFAEQRNLNIKSEKLLTKVLVEIAKSFPSGVISSIQEMVPLMDKKARTAIGLVALQRLTGTKPEDWDLQNPKKCAALLLKAAKKDETIIFLYIDCFENLSEEDRTNIAIETVRAHFGHFPRYFEKFGIKGERHFLKVALAIAESGFSYCAMILSACCKKFGIVTKSEKVRFDILLAIIKKNPSLGAQFFDDFEIKTPQYRYEIALAIAQGDPESIVDHINEFNITDESMRASIVLVASLSPKAQIMSQQNKIYLANMAAEQHTNFFLSLLHVSRKGPIRPEEYFAFLSKTFSISMDFLKEIVPLPKEKKTGALQEKENENYIKNLQFLAGFLAHTNLYNIDEKALRNHKEIIQDLFDLRAPRIRNELLLFLLDHNAFDKPPESKISRTSRLQHLTEAAAAPLLSLPGTRKSVLKTLLEKLYKHDYMLNEISREQSLIQFLLAIQTNPELTPEDQLSLIEKVMTAFAPLEALETAIQQTPKMEDQLILYKKIVSPKTYEEITQSQLPLVDQLARLKKYSFTEAQKNALQAIRMIERSLLFCDLKEDFDELKTATLGQLSTLFEKLFKRPMGLIDIPNFSEKYEKTIESFRNKELLFTYVGQHKKEPLLGEMIQDILNGTFLENRYSHKKQPHLQFLFDVEGVGEKEKAERQQLEKKWQTGKRLVLSELKNQPGYENLQFNEALKNYTLENTDSPNDLLLVGIGASCQKIINGDSKLNIGILSYMLNGYNRAIVVKDEHGNIIGRSLLRIYWDEKNKTPVLFREYYYGDQSVKHLVDAMCLQEAKEMNLPITTELSKASETISYDGTLQLRGGRAEIDYVDALNGLQKSEHSLPGATLLWKPEAKKG